MSELVDKDAFLKQESKWYCENCDRRKGVKNGRKCFVYEIGEVPCRACDVDDVLDDLEDFPTASPWHRVEDDPPDEKADAIFYYEWTGISGTVHRETSIISLGNLIALGCRPIAWMKKPKPPKEDQPDDYDPCYECGGYGDDYRIEDGELVSNCPDCPFNEREDE